VQHDGGRRRCLVARRFAVRLTVFSACPVIRIYLPDTPANAFGNCRLREFVIADCSPGGPAGRALDRDHRDSADRSALLGQNWPSQMKT
jgi:hypothetical protein